MKKKVIILISILLIIIYAIYNIISYAGGATLHIGINATHSNGVGYGIGNPQNAGAGVEIWNLRNYDSADRANESNIQKELYCLKANYGESWEENKNNIVEYNLVYDLQKEREKLLGLLIDSETNSANDVVSNILNADTGYYKELLWILDNAYIPEKSDINALLEKIGITYDADYEEYYYEPSTEYDYSSKVGNTIYSYTLIEADIKAVQQAVIWYFTNAMLDGDTNLDKKDLSSWLTVTTDGINYTNLEDLTKFESSEGEDRLYQAIILYNYLIDSAINNASNYTEENGYAIQTPVEFNSTGLSTNENEKYEIGINKSGTNYIIGPIKINKNNELDYNIELKVTNENNEEITDSSYKFTDSTGVSLGTTNIKELVGKTEGFYITVARKLAKQVNIDINMSYRINTKQIWLSGVENGTTSITLNAEQPAVEVATSEEKNTLNVSLIAIPDEFDLALRKYITKINGTDITDTRVPNIALDTLQTDMTATYNHRKDPVIVKKGDSITYKITIYNEGNKNGYATKITDQLPTGLKYTGGAKITTNKNTYNVRYNETKNIITFSTNTNTAINKYETNTLDSETLEFTCEVTATPDTSNDKILTNVAWISGAYDSDLLKEIINVGDDVDSRPQTCPTVDKDSIENYKGNSSNKTDLTDSSYFYKGEQDDDDFEKLKIEPETTVTVTKTWEDNENQDGIRPSAITVNLLADGTEISGKTATLNESNEWTYTFDSLPLKSNGKEITYSVAEVSEITGYDSSVNGFTITNTHEPVTTQISVEKKWEDNNDQDGIRPNSITVNLLADGTAVTGKSIELNDTNSWKHRFTDLPVYSNGTKINYTVSEPTLSEGYTTETTGDETTGFVITNTHEPATTQISVEKKWEDNNDQDGIRPNSITVNLLADGTAVTGKTATLDESNNWKYTFTGLQEKENGTTIEYTVEEETVPEGYTVKLEGDMTQGYTITNTHKIFDLSLRKYIAKVNGTNISDTRVPSIEVGTLETGTTAVYKHRKDPVKVTENDVVTYKIAVLNEGEKTGYASQIIDQLPTGLIYNSDTTVVSKNSTGTNKNTYTVTYDTTLNKLTFDIVNTTENPAKELQPYETNKLDMELIEIQCKVVAQADTTNNKILTNVAWISGAYDTEDNQVAKDRDSKPETSPNVNKDNTENYTGNTNNKEDLTDNTYYYEGEQDDDDFEKLVFEKEVVSVSVTKVWEDNENQDGIRPTEISVSLLADGTVVDGKTVKLNEINNWKYTFKNLSKKQNGTDIDYTIQEEVPTGYTAKTTGNITNGFTITNTHIPETINIPVEKKWEDNNNQDGKRPTQITITLYANGEETEGQAVILDETNNWKYTFTNLPKKAAGLDIAYTITETGIPTEYDSKIEGDMNNGFTITNTYTPETRDISAKKVWEDNNNQDGARPSSIQLILKADGNEVQKITLTGEEKEWSHTFSSLPKYSNGTEIQYTVEESGVPEGYSSISSGSMLVGFTITNTYTPGKTTVKVTKVWEDNNDQDGIRPDSVSVSLLADGTVMEGKTIDLNEENNWTYTFTDLPIKANGTNIKYTIIENTIIDGYTTTITNNNVTTTAGEIKTTSAPEYIVTNTHETSSSFDLALRKNIIKINDKNLTELGISTRVPNIVEDSLETGTTATYKHKKDPVKVEENDIITYAITIYNEGEKAGYVSQIIDQLPTGLIYSSSDTVISKDNTGAERNTYTVTYDTTTNKLKFTINNTDENPATDLEAYRTGKLDYETIEIKCKVIHKAKAGEKNILTNVAWISEAYDSVDGTTAVDRDSEPETRPSVNKDNMENYKGNTNNKDNLEDKTYYYEGEQDDDDFEKLYVKTFDLSLRKFVAQVDGKQPTDLREPMVDVTPLVKKTGTTAIYKHPKKPVALKVGDTVIYTIRVYNEGEIDGFANEVKDYLPPYLEYVENSTVNNKYGWSISGDGRIATTAYLANKEISAFNGTTLDYEDLQIECKVSTNAIPDERITNIAEISEYQYGDTVVAEDIDSKSNNIEANKPENKDLPDYKKEEEKNEYVPGNEDDDDFEKVYVKEFDLALRKFITQIQNREITTRIPQVKYENEQISYEHPKDVMTLHVGDTVIYTIRIYNEGEISGYASEITDDIPEYLEYLPEESTNVKYMWEMYGEDGNKTESVEEAVKVKTKYLSQQNGENNLLQGFDGNTLYYRDIQIAFKVKDPNSNTVIITNHAQISDDTDEKGNPIKDKDSETDKWNEREDDQDIENVKVEYFDLSILKFVSKVIVEENEKQKITETGYNGHEKPEPVVKVELHRNKLNDIKVKFGYGITITNEGDIPGYASEITDYIPEGLKFDLADNPNWKDEGNNVISTRQLEGTLLQPGESATVEVILTWINGQDNLALKTNIVEISKDNNQYNVSDRDSTPDNKQNEEDDIDLAKVILTVATGSAKTYFLLALGILSVIVVGIALIKKFVI